MKNIIILFFALIIMSACNSGTSKEIENPDFKDISWESEKLSIYQLVRPINYSKGAVDAYGRPILDGQWYLINKSTECYLLPVLTDGDAMGPNFVENVTRWNKVAIIDTMFSGFMMNSKTFEGLQAIHTMEIVCFKSNWFVEPAMTPSGQISVSLNKKE